MCRPRSIIIDFPERFDSDLAESKGFYFSGFGINGIIYKHIASGEELELPDLMRLYPRKEELENV